MSCSFSSAEGACPYDEIPGTGRCVFHYGVNPVPAIAAPSIQDFEQQLDALIGQKMGRWIGFVFPGDYTFSNRTFDFEIDARGCRFKRLELDNVTFRKNATFRGSVCEGSAIVRRVVFEGEADFRECR